MSMSIRALACLSSLCLGATPLVASRLAAQEMPAIDSTLHRTARQDGHDDGRRAADRRHVASRVLVGGLAGVPLGFFGSVALVVGPQPEIVAAAALGGGVLLLARRPGDTTPPDSLAALAARNGPAYEQAWRAGYQERLGERRQRAANVGGVIGAIVGTALILTILLNPDYT